MDVESESDGEGDGVFVCALMNVSWCVYLSVGGCTYLHTLWILCHSHSLICMFIFKKNELNVWCDVCSNRIGGV